MNRRDRRANSHRRQHTIEKIRDLQHHVETTGLPGIIDGLHSACIDCRADGEMLLLPGHRVVARIFHSDGCPVLTGVVTWRPVPITEEADALTKHPAASPATGSPPTHLPVGNRMDPSGCAASPVRQNRP